MKVIRSAGTLNDAPPSPPSATSAPVTTWSKGYELELVHKPITIASRSYPDGRRVCRARWMAFEGFDVTQEPDRVHPGAAIGRLLKQALNEQGLAHLRAALDEPSPEEAARRDGAA